MLVRVGMWRCLRVLVYEGGMLKSVCFKDVGADDACGCVKVFKSVGVLECL